MWQQRYRGSFIHETGRKVSKICYGIVNFFTAILFKKGIIIPKTYNNTITLQVHYYWNQFGFLPWWHARTVYKFFIWRYFFLGEQCCWTLHWVKYLRGILWCRPIHPAGKYTMRHVICIEYFNHFEQFYLCFRNGKMNVNVGKGTSKKEWCKFLRKQKFNFQLSN